MKTTTIEDFCRDASGRLDPIEEAIRKPFRIGRLTIATNRHCIVWRTTRQEDRAWPILAANAKPGRASVLAIIAAHPGTCRNTWPTAAECPAGPIESGYGEKFRRVMFPTRFPLPVNAAYRDRIARFGKAQGEPVLYAKPRSNQKPIPFTVGKWRGMLMGLRSDA